MANRFMTRAEVLEEIGAPLATALKQDVAARLERMKPGDSELISMPFGCMPLLLTKPADPEQ